MILRNLFAFLLLCFGMSFFVFFWMTLDYFTKGF